RRAHARRHVGRVPGRARSPRARVAGGHRHPVLGGRGSGRGTRRRRARLPGGRPCSRTHGCAPIAPRARTDRTIAGWWPEGRPLPPIRSLAMSSAPLPAPAPPFFFDGAELGAVAHEHAAGYRDADPFPHAVIDDFLPQHVIDGVLAEFPSPENPEWYRFHSDR